MPTTNPQVLPIIRAMREYIQEHGWLQGLTYGRNGAVCIFGAYNIVAKSPCSAQLEREVFSLIRNTLDVNEPTNNLPTSKTTTFGIVTWNDQNGRTKDDVIRLLEATEARAMNQEASA